MEDIFKVVGNKLGLFLEVDMSFKETKSRIVAKILVKLDPRDGLAEKIDFYLQGYMHSKLIDYEKLPSQCHHCHEHGHLM